jgi:hypothetical protein
MNQPVLQEWMHDLPLKKQSAVLSALRGPDHAFCKEVKKIVKMLRRATQLDADPTSDYMNLKSEIDWKQLERELEFCPLHFVAHLIEAIVIVRDEMPGAGKVLGWFEDTFHLAPSRPSRVPIP